MMQDWRRGDDDGIDVFGIRDIFPSLGGSANVERCCQSLGRFRIAGPYCR
jgi:hypothetical protein